VKLARLVVKNTFYRTAAKIVGNVSGLFIAAVLARLLGPHEFGVYSLAITISLLCVSLADQGITATAIRYISYYHGKQDLIRLRSYFRYLFKLGLVVSMSISFVLIILSGYLSSVFRDPLLKWPLVFAGLLVVFSAILNITTSLFAGLQRFEYVFLKQLVYETSRWMFVLPLSILFFAAGAVAGTSLAYAFTLAILFLVILLKFKTFIFGITIDISKKNINKFIGFMSLTNISSIILTYTDILMIGYLLSTTDVGYYRAAVIIVIAAVGLLTVFDVLLSAFSRLDDAELKNAVNKVAKYSISLSFPLAVVLYYLSSNIISIIYGSRYIQSIDVMAILSFLLVPNAFNFIGPVFISRNMPEYPALLTTLAMILNIFLDYIFIIKFGIIGAALATVISRCLMSVIGMYLLVKYVKVSIFNVTFKSILSLLLVFYISKLVPISGVIGKLVLSILLVLVYLIIVFVLGVLTLNDFKYLKKIIF